MRIRVFRHLPELEAFDVTPEYRALAERIGLAEWNPVVWIGRYFALDNDFGEHWFDNWEGREARRERAERAGINPTDLLVLDPDRFKDGADGPCHSSEMRQRFWTDVLISLELSTEQLFEQARERNRRTKALVDAGDVSMLDEYLPDLEQRIEAWSGEKRHSGIPAPTKTREPSEVPRRAERLVKALEAVFDSDWDYTMSQLGIDRERQRRAEAELLRLLGESIPPSEPEGTFLKPSDPSSAGDNWGNYCELLDAYAELRALVSSPAAPEAPRSLRRAQEEIDELYDELTAAEGSFMLQLHNGTWHQGAFRRFVRLTHAYLEARDADASIPRWIAEGLWTLEHLASDWLHNSPPGSDRERRYRDRVETVHLLSGWLFTGGTPKTFDLEGSD